MRVRLSVLLAGVLALLGVLVPASDASAAPRAYPVTICATLSVSTTTPLVGQSIQVSGRNFDPNATIKLELQSKPWPLGSVKSDARGSFDTSVKLPAGVTGGHLIVAVGGNTVHPSECPADPAQLLNIHAAGAGSSNGAGNGVGGNGGGTAFTGVDVLLLVLIAAVLLAAGVALSVSGRRRRQRIEWYS
jgi:hypothetical protein